MITGLLELDKTIVVEVTDSVKAIGTTLLLDDAVVRVVVTMVDTVPAKEAIPVLLLLLLILLLLLLLKTVIK